MCRLVICKTITCQQIFKKILHSWWPWWKPQSFICIAELLLLVFCTEKAKYDPLKSCRRPKSIIETFWSLINGSFLKSYYNDESWCEKGSALFLVNPGCSWHNTACCNVSFTHSFQIWLKKHFFLIFTVSAPPFFISFSEAWCAFNYTLLLWESLEEKTPTMSQKLKFDIALCQSSVVHSSQWNRLLLKNCGRAKKRTWQLIRNQKW